jgi:hypothetical protein
MAESQTQLQIVITALDEASNTLRQIATSSSSAMQEVASSTNEASEAHKGFMGTLEGTIHNVFDYVIAYELLEKTLETVHAFFEEAISGAMEAGDTLAQLKVNVENAGLSYKQLGPEIAETAQQHIALGFGVEETEQSLGRLLLTTGSYKDAVALNNLAMDLSRSKQIDLATATQLVEQVMAGNTRIMKQYGISLDSATTSAQALTILQDKVKGSTEAAADTAAGKWREVQAQWQDIENQVGDELLPVLEQLFTVFEQNLPAITTSLTTLGNELRTDYDNLVAIGNATGSLFLLKSFVVGLEASFTGLTNAIGFVRAGIEDLQGGSLVATANGFGLLSSGAAVTTDDFNKLSFTTDITGQSVSNAAGAFDDITNRIHSADSAALKHADAIAKLADEYDKMKDQGAVDLASLTDEFQQKSQSIGDSINSIKLQIQDLNNSYNTQSSDAVTQVADKIAASETKITDLKTKIASIGDTADVSGLTQAQKDQYASQKATLEKQLEGEQANYDSSLQFRQDHADAVAAAETRAGKTDLQRTIDDYSAKQALAAQDYNTKLSRLNQELAAKQNEQALEFQLYQEKSLQIKVVLDTAQVYFMQLSADRVDTTTKEVDAEIQQFQKLAAVISATKSASMSAFGAITVPSTPAVHVKDAVITPGGQVIHTDPADYLFATKNPASLGGGGGITVNVTGNTISNNLDLSKIAQAVSKEIVKTLGLNQRISV